MSRRPGRPDPRAPRAAGRWRHLRRRHPGGRPGGQRRPVRWRPVCWRPARWRDRDKQLRLLHQLRRAADGAPDPRVGAAPAELAGQRGRRPRVVRMRGLAEQRRRRHQPAGRAVTALHRAGLQPRLLHRVQDAVFGQALDRRHPLACGGGGRRRAGRHGAAADQHRAGPAGALAAAELGAGQPEVVPEHRQQAAVPGVPDLAPGTVDDDRDLHQRTCLRARGRRPPSVPSRLLTLGCARSSR